MNTEQLQLLSEKVTAAISVLATKLGVASEYVFSAGIRYQIGCGVSQIIGAIIFSALTWRIFPSIRNCIMSDEVDMEIRCIVVIGCVIGASFLLGFICNAIYWGIPLLFAPDYAVIKDLLGALK